MRNALAAQKEDQQKLQTKRAKALEKVEAEQALLDAKFDEQAAVLDDLNAKKARAQEIVKSLEKRYARELEALTESGVPRGRGLGSARSTSRGPCTTGSALPDTVR